MTSQTIMKVRVAFYLRVSSDEQRERQTIRTQEDILKRWLEQNQERLEVVGWFKDDGVPGPIPFEKRPEGKRLAAIVEAHLVDQIVVTRIDRLGRTSLDLIRTREHFEPLSVSIIAVLENIEDPFDYELRAVLAADERRRFLKRSREGMERAAREGRYCGGIVPLGYVVEGKKQDARLVPSDKIMWGDWTEAGLVRQIYRWLAIDGWSTVRIADHLNALGVPTSYTKDERLLRDETGRRSRHTEGIWRPGRIRNLVVNPVYKGTYLYGRRSKKQRDLITADVPALVSPELWAATQETLTRNRLITKHSNRVNLLKSVMFCSLCGLSYGAMRGRDGIVYYRCGGQVKYRGKSKPEVAPCPCRYIRADFIEPIVVADLRRFLTNPGQDLLDELKAEAACPVASAVGEAERLVVERALASIPAQRDRLLEMRMRDLITLDELEAKFAALRQEESRLGERLAELSSRSEEPEAPLDPDLIVEISRRVEDGLDERMWQEIVSILVKRIDVVTEIQADGRKKATITITYRFPRGVVGDDPGTGSSQNYTNLQRVLVL